MWENIDTLDEDVAFHGGMFVQVQEFQLGLHIFLANINYLHRGASK